MTRETANYIISTGLFKQFCIVLENPNNETVRDTWHGYMIAMRDMYYSFGSSGEDWQRMVNSIVRDAHAMYTMN